LVKKRINREKISYRIFKKAKKIIKILSLIPTLRAYRYKRNVINEEFGKHDDN